MTSINSRLQVKLRRLRNMQNMSMRNKQTCENLINKYVCRTRSGIEFCMKMYTFNTGVINMCVRHHTVHTLQVHISSHHALYNTNELSLGDWGLGTPGLSLTPQKEKKNKWKGERRAGKLFSILNIDPFPISHFPFL